MKRILVLGSEGFIGSHVVNAGLQNGYTVHGVDVIDRNPSHYAYDKISLLSPDFDSFLINNKFDTIFNCAGSGNVSFSVQHPLNDFELNCTTVVFVLDAIRKHQATCKYVHLSSAAVYGNPVTLPVTESSPVSPVSPYGYHKWMTEIICKEYAMLYGLSIAIARPFSVYGPGLQKQLIWDVYHKAKNETDITLWGTGEETRDFIYVEDLAEALLAIAEKIKETTEIYNLASGVSVTVKYLVQQLFQQLNWQRNVGFNGIVRLGDPRFWQADISKLVTTGYRLQITLSEGLNRTAKWLHANNEN
ncbi:MAG: NAD-dependent epimerase/dehydratase family protein [Chitinophagaceae bacterium]|nr:NAD-dependent epimerase/dehydratase family protein [Chitinophagaceae bacterium]